MANKIMHWDKLLTTTRYGKLATTLADPDLIRTEFQRDYDRIIFSSPFRRLQNKTQVFPLPGSIFVHNRLTHSLEVASIGRSLGNIVAKNIKNSTTMQNPVLLNEIGSIVAAASLAHDLGNPPFGHSGEKALSEFFVNNPKITNNLSPEQKADITNFEGNANALRLLTHRFTGRRMGGYVLTYATLAALVKYPFGAVNRNAKNKYGFFETEKQTFKQIANTVGLIKTADNCYARHPLVYLVEAADDIAYQIMDIEDAHKLKILNTAQTVDLLMAFFNGDTKFCARKTDVFNLVTDSNEQIAYLRASVINRLVNETAEVFCNNIDSIMAGTFNGALVNNLTGTAKTAMQTCSSLAANLIYCNRSVIEIEITGFNVLNTLLNEFVNAVFSPKAGYSKRLLELMPQQYRESGENDYIKLRSVLDFISGMTDLYALDLYKLIKGIGI